MRAPEAMIEAFRARGLKVTPQRECIFGLLYGTDVHPTAEAVYTEARRRMPTMSLKTVYQTLNDLAEMGEIQLLDLGTGAARFDPNVEPHHHLVCTQCGKVRDLYADFPGLEVPAEQDQGFTVDVADVIFRGHCPECRAGLTDRPRLRTPSVN